MTYSLYVWLSTGSWRRRLNATCLATIRSSLPPCAGQLKCLLIKVLHQMIDDRAASVWDLGHSWQDATMVMCSTRPAAIPKPGVQDNLEAAAQHLAQLTAAHEREQEQWLAERSALLEELDAQQAQAQATQTTQMRQREQTRQPLQAKLEGKLREQLAKKDRLVRALRDAIKQLGAQHSPAASFGVRRQACAV